jgi:hypothetical protein
MVEKLYKFGSSAPKFLILKWWRKKKLVIVQRKPNWEGNFFEGNMVDFFKKQHNKKGFRVFRVTLVKVLFLKKWHAIVYVIYNLITKIICDMVKGFRVLWFYRFSLVKGLSIEKGY